MVSKKCKIFPKVVESKSYINKELRVKMFIKYKFCTNVHKTVFYIISKI